MNKNIFIQTFLISVVFFVVLFVVSYMASMTPAEGGIKIEPIYVFIALVPFVVLLIASGKLKEIKGPGGIALLMKDEAESKISLEVEDNTLEIDPQIVHSKGGLESLAFMVGENAPTALSFVLKRKNYYASGAISGYLTKLRELGEFRYIIFQSEEGEFSGYMKVADFVSVVEKGGVVDAIESGSIMQNMNINKECIAVSSSNREALSAMEISNLNELAVVNSENRFVGIINQEQIVRKVLSRIVREA